MRYPDVTDLRFLARTLIVALAIYICIVNLIDGRSWNIGPGACMFDNKYYSIGAVYDMPLGPRTCSADPGDPDGPAIWTAAP